MVRELRSGRKFEEVKASKIIQKSKKIQKQTKLQGSRPTTRSMTVLLKQKEQEQAKTNIKKTRSILQVQQQAISFLKSSSQMKKGYNLSSLSKQSRTQTRSKDPKMVPFTMKTRSKDTKKVAKKSEEISDLEDQNSDESKSTQIEEENNESNEIHQCNDSNSASIMDIKNSLDMITQGKSQPQVIQTLQQNMDMQPKIGLIDVVFCCDTTYSMDSYIQEVKKAINQISQNIVQKVGLEGIDVKFGFVGYQNHKPQDAKYVTKVFDLDSDVKMMKLIEEEKCYGGGDNPEAVLDGLWDCVDKISWRQVENTPYLRYVYHICDAPPHGKIYSDGSYNFSKGCPCNLTAEQIGKGMHEKQIHYRLIKTSDYGLEKMTQIFQKCFTDFDQYTLKEAPELNVRVSDMFNNEVFPEYQK